LRLHSRSGLADQCDWGHSVALFRFVEAVYRGEAASGEHRRLLESALAREWRTAQKALTRHVQDCVDHMVGSGLIG
jgi:DNA-binding GntR family transcriptional regulator